MGITLAQNVFTKGNNTVSFAATVSGRIATLTMDNPSKMAVFVEVVQQPSFTGLVWTLIGTDSSV